MDRKNLIKTETTTGSFATDLFKPSPRKPRFRYSIRQHLIAYLYGKVAGKRSVHTWSCKRTGTSERFFLLAYIDRDLIGFQATIYMDWRGGCVPVTTSRFWSYGDSLQWMLREGMYCKTILASCRPVPIKVDTNYRQKFAKFLARFF